MKFVKALAAAALLPALLASPTATAPAQAATVSCTAVTPLSARPALKAGDDGSCVRTLKNLLLTKGYSLGGMWPGGTWDAATTTMLATWQADNGRPATASVNTDTWKAIASSTGRTAYTRTRGPNTTGKVVLSFDDCPTSYAAFKAAVLAAERLNIALVLFPTGQCRNAGRFSVTYAREHGHYVFNHTISHPDLRDLSYSQVYAQLGSPGVVTNYGRPPYGATNATVTKAYTDHGMRVWTWTFDTQDYKGLSRTTIVNSVVNNATVNSTVLMHMQHAAFNETALKAMVAGLSARGLAVCGNYPGTTPKAPTTFRC